MFWYVFVEQVCWVYGVQCRVVDIEIEVIYMCDFLVVEFGWVWFEDFDLFVVVDVSLF